MTFTYAYDDVVSVGELFQLLDKMMTFKGDRFPARNVFHVDLRDEKKEHISLESTVSVTARDNNGCLIGYLRVLTDQVYIFYILDVMVDPAYRRQGVGSKLLGLTVETIKTKGFMKMFLTAIPGAEDFYRQFGFKEGMSPVLTMRGEDYQ